MSVSPGTYRKRTFVATKKYSRFKFVRNPSSGATDPSVMFWTGSNISRTLHRNCVSVVLNTSMATRMSKIASFGFFTRTLPLMKSGNVFIRKRSKVMRVVRKTIVRRRATVTVSSETSLKYARTRGTNLVFL